MAKQRFVRPTSLCGACAFLSSDIFVCTSRLMPTGQLLSYAEGILREEARASVYTIATDLQSMIVAEMRLGDEGLLCSISTPFPLLPSAANPSHFCGLDIFYWLSTATAEQLGCTGARIHGVPVQKKIGHGATSIVFLGGGTPDAQFVVKQHLGQRETASQEIAHEIAVLSEIRSSIPDEATRDLFPRAEQLGTDTLKLWPYCNKPLSLTRTNINRLLDILYYAHRAGYVHRDIRPPNLGCVDDVVYLYDWGYAARLGCSTSFAGGRLYAPLRLLANKEDRYVPCAADDLQSLVLLIIGLCMRDTNNKCVGDVAKSQPTDEALHAYWQHILNEVQALERSDVMQRAENVAKQANAQTRYTDLSGHLYRLANAL